MAVLVVCTYMYSEREEGPSSISCRMAETGGTSEEEARGAVADDVGETWKEVNREVAFRSTGTADRVCLNLARIDVHLPRWRRHHLAVRQPETPGQ
jgi:hypothetical protein